MGQEKPKTHFDPDDYRMTVGEHLEELRRRLILVLAGFFVALTFCLVFGRQVVAVFCAPFFNELLKEKLNPQLYYHEMGEGFTVYLTISIVTAVAIAAPWILHQLWAFVAAGLYPNERKMVTRYAPLSLVLLVGGMLFVYFLVLPWTVQFFIGFGNSIPLPASMTEGHPATTLPAQLPAPYAALDGDPPDPKLFENRLWFNTVEGRIKTFVNNEIRVMPFSPSNALAPQISINSYIDLVIGMLLTFGLSFQLQLVVMALAKVGIVEVETLKSMRKYVYFGLAILSCAITPGDVITASVALTFPLVFLYELGIWLANFKPKTIPNNS